MRSGRLVFVFLLLLLIVFLTLFVWFPYQLVKRLGALRGMAFLISIIAAISIGYKLAYPTYSWNQKLTISVATPQGVVTGSSVSRVSIAAKPHFLPEMRAVDDDISGEAAFVDFGERRYLFARLGGQEHLAIKLFASSMPISTRVIDKAREVARHIGETIVVPAHSYPPLITFGDVKDSKSVEQVDPGNLESSFGSGITLVSITLSLVDEPLSENGIEALLPCLSSKNPCVALNLDLPYGHPLRHIPNSDFWRK